MRISELRTVHATQPDDDGEIVIELPGPVERGVQTVTWASTPDGERLLVLVDL